MTNAHKGILAAHGLIEGAPHGASRTDGAEGVLAPSVPDGVAENEAGRKAESPWEVGEDDEFNGCPFIPVYGHRSVACEVQGDVDDDGGLIITQAVRDRAALIVRAVNSHDALVEALQGIIDWADLALRNPQEFDSHGVRNLDGPAFDAARAALKLARGE